MERRVSYAIIGLFVILLGGATIAASLWIGYGDLAKRYQNYYVYMSESVSGLQRDAPVKYLGVDVGRVREIALNPEDPQQVRLVLEIEEGTPVKEDTVAVLAQQGVTGIAFINLSGGSPDAPLLKAEEGQEYPVIPSEPSLLMRFDTALSQLFTDLNHIAARFDELLTEENRSNLRDTLQNLERVSATLAEHSEAIERAIDDGARLMSRAAQASAHWPALTQRVESGAESVQAMAESVAAAGDDARAMAPEISALVRDLRRLARSLQGVSERLERDPGAVLFGAPPPPRGPGE